MCLQFLKNHTLNICWHIYKVLIIVKRALPVKEVSWNRLVWGGFSHSEHISLLGVTMLSQGSPFDFDPSHILAPVINVLGLIGQPHPMQNLFELLIVVPHTGVLLPS